MYIFSDEFQSIPLLPVPVTTAENINKVVYIQKHIVMFVHTYLYQKQRTVCQDGEQQKCWI